MGATVRLGSFFLCVGMLAFPGSVVAQTGAEFGQRDVDAIAYTSPTPFGDSPCSFTQNLGPNLLEPGVGIACANNGLTTDNQYIRVFDLDGDHGLEGNVCVENIEYGVEVAEGNVDLTFNVYCVPHDFGEPHVISRATLDAGFVYSEAGVQRDAELEIFDKPMSGGCCNAQSHDMAIEIAAEDCFENGTCTWFMTAGNYQGELNHWFIGAPDCDIVDPIDPGLIGGPGWFPIVMNITATCSGIEVPGLTVVGIAVTALVTAGCGAGFLRRRRET